MQTICWSDKQTKQITHTQHTHTCARACKHIHACTCAHTHTHPTTQSGVYRTRGADARRICIHHTYYILCCHLHCQINHHKRFRYLMPRWPCTQVRDGNGEVKKPESGGPGAAEDPWWGPGAMLLVGVGGQSPLKPKDFFLNLRYEKPISWHFIQFQTATHKILFTLL